jgi:hypothetical protein
MVCQGTAGVLANLAFATDTVFGRADGLIDDIAIGENTVLGRLTGGHITALSMASLAGILDHGSLLAASLLDDDHVRYANLAGRSGGQVLYGSTDASETLTLSSTSHATKGLIKLGSTNYNEAKNTLMIGASSCDGTAEKNLFIANGVDPSAHTDNGIHIYSKDSSDNTATLALWTEQAVEDIGATVAGKKLKIWLNGVAEYLILARQV